MSDSKEIVPVPEIPMMSLEDLKRLTAYVNEIKQTLMIRGKDYIIDGDRQYTCRSGFAKLAQGFTLSDEPPKITKIEDDESKTWNYKYRLRKQWVDGEFTTNLFGFEAIVRVIHNKTGRFASGEGACTIYELSALHKLSPRWYHDCLATAKTRAYNRAVSNYVGSADVSAEEMGYEPDRKVVDAMQMEVTLVKPSWNILESVEAEGWIQVNEIILSWLNNSDLNPDWFTVESDIVKATVKPHEELWKYVAFVKLNEHMQAAGFNWVEKQGLWRLNQPEAQK